jgi:hypothetical protein
VAISSSRTASAYQVQQQPTPTATRINGAAASYASGPTRVVAPTRENPNLATMTQAIKGSVEQDDLDVPAFIRKRGEIN